MTVFIQKGDSPLSVRQAEKRGQKHLNLEMKPYEREAEAANPSPEYQAWVAGWLADNVVNGTNNLFNHQLADYRKATARLGRYQLSVGRADAFEDQPTGETDPETGDPVMEAVRIQTAIEALPATIEQTTYDDLGNPTTAMVPNPLIVADDAERDAAQVVIDATPAEVKAF